ncbi:MAG: DEAD/DEAH box helicase family protein [Elusimicrobiota bacterium]|jgi:type III restriction enzyme|nr:DEAD/DEAH box helicase family protein [Elusimicrobiota bacterium]
MILKTYQQNTLDVLRKFFEICRIYGAEIAYSKIVSDPEIAARLGILSRGGYVKWDSIPNTPRICLKIPTGGGKTILAAYSAKVVSEAWREKDNPVILWLCPSDTIRKQTCEALKNPRHPYRVALDGQFSASIRVFDIDEKFNIRYYDIEDKVCLIVSTIQSFRQSATGKYNVYKTNEDLEPHFMRIAAQEGMEKDETGRIKFSFANLMFFHRPIVIVDEAHNAVSDLSQEMLGRINPSAIIEFTATPRLKNNTIYNVYASELKEEEMIKLPIELREHKGWEPAVDEAIAKRAELEKEAEKESEYIRPILLFQADDKNGEANAEKLKNYLLNTANIAPSEIAVVTSEQKELDGIDVFDAKCSIKYIVTVEALKEGWDCSFAYILCSLANVQSNTAVEQLLGRVMRMPFAKKRKSAALNKAYAYVLATSKFGETTGALVDKLITCGFDDTEAQAAIEQKPCELDELISDYAIDKVNLKDPLTETQLPQTIKTENNGKTIIFTEQTCDEDIDFLTSQVSAEKAQEIKAKFDFYKKNTADLNPSPASLGKKFSLPSLYVNLQGEFVFADTDDIFMNFEWSLMQFADIKIDEDEFSITPQGHSFIISLDGNQLNYSSSGGQLYIPSMEVENWTAANLIVWLDETLHQSDIIQDDLVEWLRQTIDYLTQKRGIKLASLMIAKYALAGKLAEKIKKARQKARETSYQTALFGSGSIVELNFDNGFEFFESMYDGELMMQMRYKFQKHYLGSKKIPLIDGGDRGEEFECAKAIDSLPQVKFWLRNLPRNKNSFWLPTSEDRFYPDFVGELEDGRKFAIEYKGAHLIDSQDTKRKEIIGQMWEKASKGKALFALIVKNKDGLDMAQQLKKKMQ